MAKSDLARAERALRRVALGLPEAQEFFPWGERAIKVRRKTFLFMRLSPDELSFSLKLPHSRGSALALSFAEPTGYGLGKSGWVTFRLRSAAPQLVDDLEEWIVESYRAVAPKRLIAALDQGGG